MQCEAALPRRFDAAARARQALTQSLAAVLDPAELDSAKLIATELVNNAVVHGQGRIRLRADVDDDRLLIEVIDEGGGFEHVAREVPFEKLSGRGLWVVDAVSSRWGVHEGTTHVWAELERPGPRLGEQPKREPPGPRAG
jgi:anti-sigma regulatory factor (Ser/Thr protein kinase)